MRKLLLFAAILIGIFISFYISFNSLLREFVNTAESKEILLDEHIHASTNFIEDMALNGEIFLEQGSARDSELYAILAHDEKSGSYNLDSVEGTPLEKSVASLTGLGRIPSSGYERDEINMALQFNRLFKNHLEKYPDVAWLYYTSDSSFISIYPWVPSSEFSYSKSLKDVEFFKIATPEKNPHKESVWTPVYLDAAGKGLMVTLSEPIYRFSEFKGVISLDLTNSKLSSIIASDYDSYLIDKTDTVLAAGKGTLPTDKVAKLGDVMNKTAGYAESLKSLQSDELHILGGSYVYTVNFSGAPWKMIFIVPVWTIAGKAAMSTIPILAISILLLTSMNQMGRRKRSEDLLRTTMSSVVEGIIVTDLDGRIIMMNKAAEGYTGRASNDAHGLPFDEVFKNINFATKERRDNPVSKVIETGRSISSGKHVGLVSSDGSETLVTGNAAPIISDDGSMTGVVVSFRDITKEFEQEMEIEGFLNVNLDMLCVADNKGNLLKVNRKFEEVLGYSADELEGMGFITLVHDEDIPSTKAKMNDLKSNRAVFGFINRCRCQDGSYKHIEWNTQSSYDKYIYASARDVTDKVLREETLESIATRDSLTGAFNRHFLSLIIEGEMKSSDRHSEPISMIILDLDHFKDVNDTWGHPVGDSVLVHTARIAGSTLRDSDFFIRFGGEEFVILLPHTPVDGAEAVAEKIRLALSKNPHPMVERQTASFGVAERIKGETFESWYKRVDMALYNAKESGRNRVIALTYEAQNDASSA